MTLWNGSFPFYPRTNACFPFDTTRAIIISIFLSMLATFIIILPGIRGRGVSGPQPSGPCPVYPTCLPLPSLENRLADQTCPQVHGQGSGIPSKPWGDLQPNPTCTPMLETSNSTIPNLCGTQI